MIQVFAKDFWNEEVIVLTVRSHGQIIHFKEKRKVFWKQVIINSSVMLVMLLPLLYLI